MNQLTRKLLIAAGALAVLVVGLLTVLLVRGGGGAGPAGHVAEVTPGASVSPTTPVPMTTFIDALNGDGEKRVFFEYSGPTFTGIVGGDHPDAAYGAPIGSQDNFATQWSSGRVLVREYGDRQLGAPEAEVKWPAEVQRAAQLDRDIIAKTWYNDFVTPFVGSDKYATVRVSPIDTMGKLGSDTFKYFDQQGLEVPGFDRENLETRGPFDPTQLLDHVGRWTDYLVFARPGVCHMKKLPKQITKASELPCGFRVASADFVIKNLLLDIAAYGTTHPNSYLGMSYQGPLDTFLRDVIDRGQSPNWYGAPPRVEDGFLIIDPVSEGGATRRGYRLPLSGNVFAFSYLCEYSPRFQTLVITIRSPLRSAFLSAISPADTSLERAFSRVLNGNGQNSIEILTSEE